MCLPLTLPTSDYRIGLMLTIVFCALMNLLLMVLFSSLMPNVMLLLLRTDVPIVPAPVWLMTPPSTVLDVMLERKTVDYRFRLPYVLYRRCCDECAQTLCIRMCDRLLVLSLGRRGRLLARQR